MSIIDPSSEAGQRLIRNSAFEQPLTEGDPPPPADGPTTANCLDCGIDYGDFGMDTLLPRWQWLLIHPDEGGLLCANCIVKRASKVPGAVGLHATIGITPTSAPSAPAHNIREVQPPRFTADLDDEPAVPSSPVVDNQLEALLSAFDTLYKYASDDGCPHADIHRYSRPNRARLVLKTWLDGVLSAPSAPAKD